ncbi:MAG: 50S ribosomal protein L6 [Candidatus Woesearchaeota archaeon]
MVEKEKKKALKKRPIEAKVSVPQGITASFENNQIILKGPMGEVRRSLVHPGISLEVKEGNVVVTSKKNNSNKKKMVFTFESHLKNMVKGVLEGYKYTLKICAAHFPMSVAVQGNQLVIKNFVGEKTPRTIELHPSAKVKVEGDKIIIESPDKEVAGMVASRIEEKTKRRAFDPNRFQDGIYIIDKGDK